MYSSRTLYGHVPLKQNCLQEIEYTSLVWEEFYGRVLKVYVAVYFSEWFYQYPDLVHKTESTITKKGKILVFRTEALSGKKAKTQ